MKPDVGVSGYEGCGKEEARPGRVERGGRELLGGQRRGVRGQGVGNRLLPGLRVWAAGPGRGPLEVPGFPAQKRGGAECEEAGPS